MQNIRLNILSKIEIKKSEVTFNIYSSLKNILIYTYNNYLSFVVTIKILYFPI